MKKILCIALSALMAVSYTSAAYADDSAPYVYETDEYGVQRVLTPIKGMDGYFVSEVVNGVSHS